MPSPITGPFPLDDVQMPTWLLRFDRHGACTSPATRAMLLQRLAAQPPSDLIFFSHGWNNDFNDAAALYAGFLKEFEALAAQQPIARPAAPGGVFAPLFVGVVWPSVWLSFDSGPQIAAAPAAASDAAAEDPAAQALAGRVAAASGAPAAERLYALLSLPQLNETQARELAAIAAPAFGDVTDDETGAARKTGTDELLSMLRAMQKAEGGGGAPASIDDWGDPPPGAVAAEPQTAGLFGFLDPRHLVRLASVWQMKDRAGVVGAHGVAALLRETLAALPGASRVHAVGHSYGCKVMLSAVCSPAPLARKLDSLLLLQPAVSHLCFADTVPVVNQPGGYRGALERVQPPILCTYSRRDVALHKTFHLALRRDSDLGEQDIGIAADIATSAGSPPSKFAALGGYGPRRAGQKLVDPIPAVLGAYPALDAAKVIGLDGSNGLIDGHGDVKSPATAWALHRLIAR